MLKAIICPAIKHNGDLKSINEDKQFKWHIQNCMKATT